MLNSINWRLQYSYDALYRLNRCALSLHFMGTCAYIMQAWTAARHARGFLWSISNTRINLGVHHSFAEYLPVSAQFLINAAYEVLWGLLSHSKRMYWGHWHASTKFKLLQQIISDIRRMCNLSLHHINVLLNTFWWFSSTVARSCSISTNCALCLSTARLYMQTRPKLGKQKRMWEATCDAYWTLGSSFVYIDQNFAEYLLVVFVPSDQMQRMGDSWHSVACQTHVLGAIGTHRMHSSHWNNIQDKINMCNLWCIRSRRCVRCWIYSFSVAIQPMHRIV